MRNRTKGTAVLLTLALTAASVSGCGGQNQTQTTGQNNAPGSGAGQETAAAADDFSEHMDISLAYWDVEANFAGGQDDAVLKALEDKFNITFVPQNISWDDYEQKLQLWAASDSLPDVFVGGSRTTANFSK